MASKHLTIRCPDTLRDTLEKEANKNHGGLSRVVIERLENTLSSVPLVEREALPALAGIYFVKSSEGKLLHVGRTDNLQAAWQSHPRLGELLAIDAGSRIFWIEADDRLVVEESVSGVVIPASGAVDTSNFVPLEIFTQQIAGLKEEMAEIKKPLRKRREPAVV